MEIEGLLVSRTIFNCVRVSLRVDDNLLESFTGHSASAGELFYKSAHIWIFILMEDDMMRMLWIVLEILADGASLK